MTGAQAELSDAAHIPCINRAGRNCGYWKAGKPDASPQRPVLSRSQECGVSPPAVGKILPHQQTERTTLNTGQTEFFNIPTNRKNHIAGFIELAKGRVLQGWKPSLVTFQFNQLPGGAKAFLSQARTEIVTLYRKLVPHVQRFPTTRMGALNVPILLSSADLPVFKHNKKSLAEVTINGGLHCHALILVPPNNRLRGDLETHFLQEQERYLRGSRLSSIHTVSINDGGLERAVGYALKGIGSGRLGYDDSFLVLPRALAELG
jgi:hypothetical protein